MSRVFSQYSPVEQFAVLDLARFSAQCRLDDERERTDLLSMQLDQAEKLLSTALLGQPFKRAARQFLNRRQTAIIR